MSLFRKIAKISLVLVYLVIVAGAVVRMTGSGMGCPDWPKCFGYYVPPTEVETLLWQSERNFKEGQVIIMDQRLMVAKEDFTTTSSFDADKWEEYDKHDYAKFNVWHTWIEYINRLFGAVAGLATLLLGFLSLKLWKKNKKLTILSWAVVFAMGFQAWLGATVVYSVLEPIKITLHMLMALVIVGILLFIIQSSEQKIPGNSSTKIRWLLLVALLLTVIQIIMGTQVRQFVDGQIDTVGELAKNLWLQKPTFNFFAHRSFSIVVLLLNGYLFYYLKKYKLGFDKINWVILLILLEIITGLAMYYIDFPFGSQPLHLVLASLLFGVQFYLVLEAFSASKSNNSL